VSDRYGFLLVDKPRDWTSHDVVAKLRGITGIRKIGHAGTLDPMATGLLVVGIGRATKQLASITGQTKAYEAEITLGAVSDTDDAEGAVTPRQHVHEPELADVVRALEGFQGTLQQLPPAYAAIKHQGRKLYELARAGREVPREPRTVVVHELILDTYSWPRVQFRCVVSKGTYIRALARDIGEQLECGGYLSALRRTAIGNFDVSDAVSIDELQKGWEAHVLADSKIKQDVVE
jgi:tRNA pseudouridine55 synthase